MVNWLNIELLATNYFIFLFSINKTESNHPKAAIKYTNSVKKYQNLENDMNKFKKLINAIIYSNDNDINNMNSKQVNTNNANTTTSIATPNTNNNSLGNDILNEKLKTDMLANALNNLNNEKTSHDSDCDNSQNNLFQNMNKFLEQSDVEQSSVLLNGLNYFLLTK